MHNWEKRILDRTIIPEDKNLIGGICISSVKQYCSSKVWSLVKVFTDNHLLIDDYFEGRDGKIFVLIDMFILRAFFDWEGPQEAIGYDGIQRYHIIGITEEGSSLLHYYQDCRTNQTTVAIELTKWIDIMRSGKSKAPTLPMMSKEEAKKMEAIRKKLINTSELGRLTIPDVTSNNPSVTSPDCKGIEALIRIEKLLDNTGIEGLELNFTCDDKRVVETVSVNEYQNTVGSLEMKALENPSHIVIAWNFTPARTPMQLQADPTGSILGIKLDRLNTDIRIAPYAGTPIIDSASSGRIIGCIHKGVTYCLVSGLTKGGSIRIGMFEAIASFLVAETIEYRNSPDTATDKIKKAQPIWLSTADSLINTEVKKNLLVMETTRAKLIDDLQSIRQHTVQLTRRLSDISNQISSASNPVLANKGKEMLEKVAKHPKVEMVYPDTNGSLVVCTTPLTVVDDRTSLCHLIGRLGISINMANGNIKIWNIDGITRTAYGECSPSPHVNTCGAPCLGNIETTISNLMAKWDIVSVVDIIIEYLQTVNTQDEAGRKVNRWPIVDLETLEVRKDIPDMEDCRFGCAVCRTADICLLRSYMNKKGERHDLDDEDEECNLADRDEDERDEEYGPDDEDENEGDRENETTG